MHGIDPRFAHPRIATFPFGNAPLEALRGDASSARFHGWRGDSGRLYVTSVTPVDTTAPDAGLPDHDAFVLVCAKRVGDVVRPLTITTIERISDRREAIAVGLAEGATEWHVHLLADDRRARSMSATDLNARHNSPMPAALSA